LYHFNLRRNSTCDRFILSSWCGEKPQFWPFFWTSAFSDVANWHQIYYITLIVCAPYFVNLNNNTFQLKMLLFFVRLRSQQKKTEQVISSYQIYIVAILTLLF